MYFQFDVEFDYVLIRIWKKVKHFAIIFLCKQSKSEIIIEKFWFSKFDFIMLRPRAKMAPRKSFEHLGLHMTIFFQEHIKMQLYPLSFLEIRPRRFLSPIYYVTQKLF